MVSLYKHNFDGADYIAVRDDARLSRQIDRVYNCMKDGQWRSLKQISLATGDPEASVSAQLRHLKKDKFAAEFGKHDLQRMYLGSGLYKYRLVKVELGQQRLL